MVTFERPALLLLGLLLGWVYWIYARQRPPLVPAAGVWLLQKGGARGQHRRRLDLRLALLLLAGALTVLALAGPTRPQGRPSKLVVVVDASASMAARDTAGKSRVERARERVRPWLEAADRAVVVRAGVEVRAWGPASGKALLAHAEPWTAGASSAQLEAAIREGRRLLPGAAVLVVGDADPGLEGVAFLDVAGNEPNAGLTALTGGFAAVYNAGPGPWRGELTVEGERQSLNVPPGRFATATFERDAARLKAALSKDDALALDQQAFWRESRPRVALELESEAVARALAVLGARRTRTAAADGRVVAGTPPREPAALPTLYFATETQGEALVSDVDPTHPLTRGVELQGQRLPVPAPPPGGWRAIVRAADGRGLVYARGGELYLPPAEALARQPAFVVLLYNWLEPLRAEPAPLRAGERPGFTPTGARSLLSYAETNLPRPQGDRLNDVLGRRSPAPWLALLAALALVGADRLRRQAVG
ncbi:BatA domain-containing protein [Oceanithermus sp.]